MIERVSLNALKFFYFVATFGSVTLAAEKLFVTQSAVSKQIKNLEIHLGMELFERVGKTLRLTEQGKVLFTCCQQVFMQLDHCLIELKDQTEYDKHLVLSCEPTLAMKWLIPRLDKFKQLDAGFEIVLMTAGGKVDFKKQSIDIALRRNDFSWGDHIYHEKIADEYIVTVRKPQSSNNKTLLLSSSRSNLWQQLTKTQWLDKAFLSYQQHILDHFYLCIEASLAGLGTAIVSIYMVEKEISNHTLELVNVPVADGSTYHLLSYSPFYEDERKILFKEWLKKEMRQSEFNFKTPLTEIPIP